MLGKKCESTWFDTSLVGVKTVAATLENSLVLCADGHTLYNLAIALLIVFPKNHLSLYNRGPV